MKIIINFEKTPQENAAKYYDSAKKSRKKLAGLQKAVIDMEKKIARASEKHENQEQKKHGAVKKKREKKWFEKFHWFESTDGFLVICGRDAKANEALVKKHMEKTDIYFHADIFGAPHTIIKTEGKKIPQATMQETAQFAAIFSRAWKQKMAAADVYSANPEQVSKSAPTGEAIGTGAFMIYGKREWFKKTPLEFAIGANAEGRIISGPKTAVQKHAKESIEIGTGEEKPGSAAKKIKKILEEKTGFSLDLDEIIPMLPAGGVKILQKS